MHGPCFEWHYTTREAGRWIHNHEPRQGEWICIHTQTPELCNANQTTLTFDWLLLALFDDCCFCVLTHRGRMTHICVGKLTIIGSDDGLSPGRRQAIIWTNAGILLIWPLGTNFIEILIGNQAFSFKKMHLKMSSAKWRPFFLGLNVLNSVHRQ